MQDIENANNIIYDICDKILPNALANSSNQAGPGVTI